MDQRHELPPSAKKTINSLRKIGYNVTNAIADIIDNSIEANATKIDVDIVFEEDESWIRITDNGFGMNREQLLKAMQYGSDREYSENDLGKFGFGLKTASSSQCKRLSVSSNSQNELSAFCWDLDEIEEKWEVIELNKNTLDIRLKEPLKNRTGTVVLWQKLDTILGYNAKGFAKRKMDAISRDVEEHLGMVFHRFLNGDVRDKKITILLNGNIVIEPWDPFCRRERETKQFRLVNIPFLYNGKRLNFEMIPYILPAEKYFSSPVEFKRASGPKKWNAQQGFYIYRANRLIQSGGWNRIRTADEHTKLARIAVNILPDLDEAFEINIAKMKVVMPEQIKLNIERELKVIIKQAKRVYKRKEGDDVSKNEEDNNTQKGEEVKPGAAPDGKNEAEVTMEISLNNLENDLLNVANKQEARVLKKFFNLIRKKNIKVINV